MSDGFPTGRYDANEARAENVLGTRLREARMSVSLQQTQVSDQLKAYGISISSGALSKWEKGDAMPSPYQLFALCDLYGIEDVLGFFRVRGFRMNETGRRKVLEYTRDLLATGLYTEELPAVPVPEETKARTTAPEAPAAVRMVPISWLRVSAGLGSFLSEEDFENTPFEESQVPEKTDFGLYVSGDSMTPAYRDGQLIWVQRCSELRPGEIGVFILDGEGYIKKYAEENVVDEVTGMKVMQPVLISLNPAYAPIRVTPDRDLRVAGRVLNRPGT